jgi:drug/metabolite transporter (DMT)-like permease
MFWIGLLSALAASALFNLGVALQALEARATPPDEGLRLSLLVRLLQRRLWVLGLVLGVLGVPFEALAFTQTSFTVVQAALASGLLLLLALGVYTLGERVGRTEVLGVLAIIGGIALVSWGAPAHVETHRRAGVVVAVVAVLVLLSLVPFVIRARGTAGGLLNTVSCGLGFAATNIAVKLMADNVSLRHDLEAALWLGASAVGGIVATLTEMTALQVLAATTVVPLSFAVQTFLPIALEPLFLREQLSTAPYDGIPLLAGLLVVLAGSLIVGRTPAVSALAAGSG